MSGASEISGPILLVDDEEEVRCSIAQGLTLEGFEVVALARPDRALERLGPNFPGIVVSDIRMPKMDGLALLAEVRDRDPELPVLLITGHGDVPLAVEAMRSGAYDFLEKPFALSRLAEAAGRALQLRRLTLENREMRAALTDRDQVEAMMIGPSAAMVEARRKVRALAAADIDVLILGETGVGKELAARAIHEQSERRDGPFVAVCLAALPAAHIESELFGHEAGAFAGAHRARFGKFEHARGGTLLLDEIGAAPLEIQAKLLRVIEERSITRLGSHERIPLDLRFVAASNRDLEGMAETNAFRRDLLYRLAVATLRLPPLRDRPEDFPSLFQHLVQQAAARLGRPAPAVTAEVLGVLAAQAWPGNAREMRNAAERFVLGLDLTETPVDAVQGALPERVERFERGAIAGALAEHRGNLKATYESLGLSRKTLYEKMQKYSLRRQDFNPDASDESTE